jgi:hypothetical protein
VFVCSFLPSFIFALRSVSLPPFVPSFSAVRGEVQQEILGRSLLHGNRTTG